MADTIYTTPSDGMYCSNGEETCKQNMYGGGVCCLYQKRLQRDGSRDLCCAQCLEGQRELRELRGKRA